MAPALEAFKSEPIHKTMMAAQPNGTMRNVAEALRLNLIQALQLIIRIWRQIS